LSATRTEAAEVVLATANPGKLDEIRAILDDLPITLRALSDFPSVVLPEEGGDYEENAIGKARRAARATGRVSLGDDSGLEVFGLGGAPGPLSARFGGPDLDDTGRVERLLEAMAKLEGQQRRARFVCIAALATPEGDVVTARGECPGRILEVPRGAGGFGYDPVFVPDGWDCAMAELSGDDKNRISHRAIAFVALSDALRSRAWRAESD